MSVRCSIFSPLFFLPAKIFGDLFCPLGKAKENCFERKRVLRFFFPNQVQRQRKVSFKSSEKQRDGVRDKRGGGDKFSLFCPNLRLKWAEKKEESFTFPYPFFEVNLGRQMLLSGPQQRLNSFNGPKI